MKWLKKAYPLIIVLSLAASGCANSTISSDGDYSSQDKKTYSNDDFSFNYSIEYPSYPDYSFSQSSNREQPSDPIVIDNQSLINRIIIDYYEQRICNEKALSMNMYSSLKADSSQRKTIDDLEISYCFQPNSKGAYLVGVDKHLQLTWDTNAFFYSFNGLNTGYYYEMPDVWYKGNVLYMTDAYYYGLIDDNDITNCFATMKNTSLTSSQINLLFGTSSNAYYDNNINPLDIERENLGVDNVCCQLREDLFDKRIKDNSEYNDRNIALEDIHIYQSLAKVDNAICVNFSIDGITPPRNYINAIDKKWDIDLVIDNILIEKFQDCLPVVWKDRCFYTVDEAYEKRVISKDTAIELLHQYELSSKLEIGEMIPLN